MKKLLHMARGIVTLTVVGAEPERVLNACAEKGIVFWGAEKSDGVTLRMNIHAREQRRAEETAERLLCEVRTEKGEGAPFFFARLRRRRGFWAGMALSVAAVLLLSRFLLCVDVQGNERVPTAVILSQVRRLGVRPGAFGPSLDEGAIAQQALLELEELSWMAINLKGTRATVLVREKEPKPALEDASIPADVVAETTGIITHLETWQGKARFGEGDTVVEGDVVISGWMPIEPPLYSAVTDLGGRAVRAEGRVEARTWRTLTASIPTETAVKQPTGREERRFSLCLLGRRFNFYGNSGISFPKYDKITQIYTLTLPGGVELPLNLICESIREVELFSAPIDAQGAAAMLERSLERRLAVLVEDGEVVSREVSCVEEGGMLTVRLLAECREEIGRTAEWPSVT